jgi:hypothetical protein
MEKKKGPSPYQMKQIAPDLISKVYRPIIEQHVAKYRSEFEQFFQKYPDPIAALDIEEMNFRMFCVLAVEIKPDLSVFVKLIAVEDIYPIERYAPPLRQQIRVWLKNLIGKNVVSHGSNEEEVGMIRDAGHIQINTQETLHQVRFLNQEYSSKIKGEGLKHFEEYIDFKRSGCEFLKHDIPSQLFFKQAMLSLDHHLTQTPQRICGICNKNQDVLLYCLEDAFSSLLIHVYFMNREAYRLKH